MVRRAKSWIKLIDAASEKVGESVSLLAVAMMLVTTIEVVARYVFNSPTIWSRTINKQIFGVFSLFAGVYALQKGIHLRVEMLYERLSPRLRFCARLISLGVFLIFMGVLVWQGSWMASNSIASKELTQGTFKIPLYIFKTFIPAVAFLFLIEGIINFFRGRGQSNF